MDATRTAFTSRFAALRRELLRAPESWPENEYEGSLWIALGGQPIEARAVLSGAAEWSDWAGRTHVEGGVLLDALWDPQSVVAPPSLTREGRAAYVATGTVVLVEEDRITLDVGFPLVVHVGPSSLARVGDTVRIRGQMEFEQAD